MTKNQIIAVIAVAALLAVSGSVILLTSNDDDGVLVIETSPDFAPFDYTDRKGYVGIDMDIIQAVCEDMGVEFKFRSNSFDSIILSVQKGKCDIGASGFTINEDRKKQVLFSDPYAEIHQVLVVPIDSPITTADDIKDEKLQLTVQTGTTGADYAEKLTDRKHVTFQKTYADVINDLLHGHADAEVVDSTVGMSQVSAHSTELKVLDILTESPVEYYGFVFSMKNAELQQKFNESFHKIQENGTHAAILKHYEDNDYTLDTPSYYNKRPTVTAQTNPENGPYSYLYDDARAGIDMDLITAIGNHLDYNMKIKNNHQEDIIDAVIASSPSKQSMGASGFAITEELKAQVLVSDPYMQTYQVLLVKNGTEVTLGDLVGSKLAIKAGTDSKTFLEGQGYSGYAEVSNYTDVTTKVLAGDAYGVMDRGMAEKMISKDSGLAMLDIFGDDKITEYGFIFANTDTELRDVFNTALAELKANGTLDAILAYYANSEYNEIQSYYTPVESDNFWDKLVDSFYTDFIKNDRYMYIFEGLKNTLIISVLALVIGMLLGTVVAMVRSVHEQTGKLKILNSIASLYTTVIRGTPVMVQLLLIYYVIFASSSLNSVLIASVAFGLNSGAYVAESVRAGINAVPKGQMEACRSLGMSSKLAMITVILPQAVRNILPALGNEGISLLKETSVAGYIGIMDLTRGADIIRGQTYDALLPMLVAALIYLAIVLIMTRLIKIMEKRLNDAY